MYVHRKCNYPYANRVSICACYTLIACKWLYALAKNVQSNVCVQKARRMSSSKYDTGGGWLILSLILVFLAKCSRLFDLCLFFFLPYSVCRPTVHVVLALPLYIQTLVWTSCFLLLFTEDNIVVVNKKKTKLSLSSSFTYMFVLCSYFHIQGVLNLRWNTISTVWSSSIFGAIRTYMLYVFFF